MVEGSWPRSRTRSESRPDRARIHLSGVFDGSRAMELMNYLRREHVAEIVVDFSGVERFEAFGVEVLLRELAGLRAGDTAVRCSGLPPCVADRMEEVGIAVSSSLRHPRWAPWAS
jgi:anti-anti-sigma regulatory factor